MFSKSAYRKSFRKEKTVRGQPALKYGHKGTFRLQRLTNTSTLNQRRIHIKAFNKSMDEVVHQIYEYTEVRD